jgi:uncharacterized membrane protein YciS (DUF1049 family)
MKWVIRIVVVLIVFAAIGWMSEHIVLLHAHVRTAGYEPETLLAAHMSGLFAGGAAAVLIFIGMLLVDNKSRDKSQ